MGEGEREEEEVGVEGEEVEEEEVEEEVEVVVVVVGRRGGWGCCGIGGRRGCGLTIWMIFFVFCGRMYTRSQRGISRS